MRIRPTARGWAICGAGACTIVIGRLIGVSELMDLGVVPIVLLSVSVLSVLRRRPRPSIQMTINPQHPVAGSTMSVEIICESTGRASPMLLHLAAPEGLGGPQSIAVPAIASGRQRWITFDLTPSRRGAYQLGPLTVSAADPFGLISAVLIQRPGRQVFVYPAVERIDVGRGAADIFGAGTASVASTRGGADLYAIRDYHPGDDLRKVHWRSTARVGRLMIRQEDQHRDPRVTVLIDDRGLPLPHGDERFEALVSSAASVAQAFLASGFEISLSSLSQGRLVGFGKGPEKLHEVMERLCTITPSGGTPPSMPMDGPMVVLTRLLDDTSIASLQGRRLGARLLVVHTSSREADLGGSAERARNLGAAVVVRPLGRSLVDVWPSQAGAMAQ